MFNHCQNLTSIHQFFAAFVSNTLFLNCYFYLDSGDDTETSLSREHTLSRSGTPSTVSTLSHTESRYKNRNSRVGQMKGITQRSSKYHF